MTFLKFGYQDKKIEYIDNIHRVSVQGIVIAWYKTHLAATPAVFVKKKKLQYLFLDHSINPLTFIVIFWGKD